MPSTEHLSAQLTDYHLGAAVYTADGQHVGDLISLLIDQESWEIHAAVMRETRSFAHLRGHVGAGLIEAEVVVPLGIIGSKTADRIDITVDSAAVRKLRPYIAYDGIADDPDALPLEALVASTGGLALHPLAAHFNQAQGEIEVTAGERVMLGHDGRIFGSVHDILTESGALAAVVVKPIRLFSHDVVVPIRFFERGDDLVLFVDLTDEQIQHLHAFSHDAD